MTENNTTRFLIIGYQRSGTTVISHLLRGHPDVSSLGGELRIEPFFSQGTRVFTGGYASEDAKAHGHAMLFDALAGEAQAEQTHALGAKTVCNSPKDAERIVRTVSEHMPDLKVILIRRDDLVAQYGSTMEQLRTGVSHSWYQKWQGNNAKSLRIGKWLFERYVLVVLQTYDKLRTLKATNPVLEIGYEDFSADNDKTYRELLGFLGLHYVEPAWLASKKVLPSPDSYIDNYYDMKADMQALKHRFDNGGISPRFDFALKLYKRVHDALNLSRQFRKHRNRIRRQLINARAIQE